MQPSTEDQERIRKEAHSLFMQQWQKIIKSTDRMMAWLMVAQWIAAILCAYVHSPTAWAASESYGNPPIFYAACLGGLITAASFVLGTYCSGTNWTRHCLAICQMLMSALLIHLSGGRIETHFHVFGSLIILSLYRDWTVLLTASAVVAADHILRGMFIPQSVFGAATTEPWRWVEHLLWVAFAVFFLALLCRQNIAEMKAVAQRQAELEIANETNTVLEELNQTQTELVKQAGEIGRVVDSLYSAGHDMTQAIAELATNAQETLAAITQTTSIAEQVRQTAEISSQKARKVCEDAQGVLLTSDKGKLATDDTVKGMARIRDQMDKIAESMVHLSDQSKLIGEIISAVDDLSQQSNLLSVNASIEAAKAREHGKGFAVVAQEVKNLSSQSKDATSHVRRVLSDIGKASTAATMATELGTKAVIAGQEVVFQARDSILTLSANVGQSAQASTQIEVLSQQQLIGMQQVVAAMESVRVASDQNVKSVGDLESALSKLLDLGRSLKELTATRVTSDGDLTNEGTDKGLAKLWREVPQSRRHQ